MSPATHPPELRDGVRLLLVNEGPTEATPGASPRSSRPAEARVGTPVKIRDVEFVELPGELAPGDLLVVNDAATLPASIFGRVRVDGRDEDIELRLLGPSSSPGAHDGAPRWRAISFGPGDWRDDTNERPAPPTLEPGARVTLRGGLTAIVVERHEASARLLELCFDRGGPELYAALYETGRPIQYSHLDAPLELWSVQTVFAGRPWAAEMPSAGRPLTASSITSLRRRGVGIARLTHAAGVSATGDPELDALLPLPERYEIPAATVTALEQTRARGGRVIAVGTTVVRALESAALDAGGLPLAGPGVAELVITADTELRVVDGLLTGMHAPHESHYRLLRAFAPQRVLEQAWDAALGAGYRSHEFGDLALFLPRGPRREARASLVA